MAGDNSTHRIVQPRLVLITTVPITFGFFVGQIAYMKACGFHVSGVASPGPVLDTVAERERIACFGVEMPRSLSPLRDLVALVQLVRLLRRLHASIVHAHTPKGGLLGMLAAWIARVPVRVYHVHGLAYLTATGWRRALLQWTEAISCRVAQQVLCVSESVRTVAVRDGVCAASRIKVLLAGSINGVDAMERFNPARFSPAGRSAIRSRHGIPVDALVIGFIGRLVRDKGLVELVAAWNMLRDSFPALHLLVVGPFEERDPIPPEVVSLLRGDSRIHLPGEDRETEPLYAAMDIVCLPTYREGLPVVPLEAAAMCLPVVATRVPGCVDAIIDGVTGTLVPPADAPALAGALRRYLNDPCRRADHGAAGRARVLRDFAPDALWGAQQAEYVRLLRDKGLPSGDLSSRRSAASPMVTS
jgi:glycosyltransferase involved in cell wall biosynthesis